MNSPKLNITGELPLPEILKEGEKRKWHLLRRTLLSVTKDDLGLLEDKSWNQCIHELLTPALRIPSPPLKDYNSVNCRIPDAEIRVGETWIHDTNLDPEVNQKRLSSLNRWLLSNLFQNRHSIQPKISLFWHQYFPVHFNDLVSAREAYDYLRLILHEPLESFSKILGNIFVESPFLYYQRTSSIGSKMQIQDFGKYIISRFLTGQENRNLFEKGKMYHFSQLITHVSSRKIEKGSQIETDLRFLARELSLMEPVADLLIQRLYQNFVYHDSGTEDARKAILRMKDTYAETKGDIRSILFGLLHDTQFLDPDHQGVLVKSPIEFLFTSIRHLCLIEDSLKNPGDADAEIFNWMTRRLIDIGQFPGYPPESIGWPSFYRKPYQRNWSTAPLLYERGLIMQEMVRDGICVRNEILKPDWIKIGAGEPIFPFQKFVEIKSKEILALPLEPEMIQELSHFIMARQKFNDTNWEDLQTKPLTLKENQKLSAIIMETYNFLFSLPEYQFI